MAGPAVWTGRRPIRVDTDHLGVDIRDVVRPGDRYAGVDRRDSGSHSERICSDVRDDPRPEPYDSAVATGRELRVLDVIASVRRREKTFAATFAPGTGAPGSNREQRAEDVFGIET